MLKDAPTVKEIQTTMVDILANYIMKTKNINFEAVHNIKIGI